MVNDMGRNHKLRKGKLEQCCICDVTNIDGFIIVSINKEEYNDPRYRYEQDEFEVCWKCVMKLLLNEK